jgi:hypothetical protein
VNDSPHPVFIEQWVNEESALMERVWAREGAAKPKGAKPRFSESGNCCAKLLRRKLWNYCNVSLRRNTGDHPSISVRGLCF